VPTYSAFTGSRHRPSTEPGFPDLVPEMPLRPQGPALVLSAAASDSGGVKVGDTSPLQGVTELTDLAHVDEKPSSKHPR
jgi:hypothetical protein